MKQEKFEELLESVRQGGEILSGKTKPSRSFKVKIPEIQASKYLKKSYKMHIPSLPLARPP